MLLDVPCTGDNVKALFGSALPYAAPVRKNTESIPPKPKYHKQRYKNKHTATNHGATAPNHATNRALPLNALFRQAEIPKSTVRSYYPRPGSHTRLCPDASASGQCPYFV